MKEWPLPVDQSDRRGRDGIVLVSLGSGAERGPGGLPPMATVTRRLAEVLARPVLELASDTGPDAALAAIGAPTEACAGGWLAGLAIDVGQVLEDGRSWGEALGAWRQPVVLVIPAPQLASGLPAAATALLRQWRVPLLGLVQWGGAWQPELRQRDGLPWLGLLGEDDATVPYLETGDGAALAAALALRWRQLDRP